MSVLEIFELLLITWYSVFALADNLIGSSVFDKPFVDTGGAGGRLASKFGVYNIIVLPYS